jgi:hypothetical protein
MPKTARVPIFGAASSRIRFSLQLQVFSQGYPKGILLFYESVREISRYNNDPATGPADTSLNRTSRRRSNRQPLAESELCIERIHEKSDTSLKTSSPWFHGSNAGKSVLIEGRSQKTSFLRPIALRPYA